MHHRQALGLFAGFALCPLCASTVFGETPTRARIGATKARPGLTSGVLSARFPWANGDSDILAKSRLANGY